MGNYGMHLQYFFFGTVEMNTPWMVFYKDYIVSFDKKSIFYHTTEMHN